ncbi:MAG: hypothetical protein BWY06_00282 [Candidatus Latescibacteria bacterium ADurb.Bin168]|nr:MAG: hypothetical protein BWY06_00282 [Candidatus Latescibacteria bacterium ADurb.Bin168]
MANFRIAATGTAPVAPLAPGEAGVLYCYLIGERPCVALSLPGLPAKRSHAINGATVRGSE